MFTLTNGVSMDITRNIPKVDSPSPWIEIGIPLAHLPLTDDQVQGAQLKSLMIAGDRTGTIYISKMSLISDSTPIRAEIEGSRDVDKYAYKSYTAHASGGPSNLIYAWKFSDDDSTPTGRTVSHRFAIAGDFKVSVTVLDADELKPGVKVTHIRSRGSTIAGWVRLHRCTLNLTLHRTTPCHRAARCMR